MAAIPEFTTNLQHVAGKTNFVTDALSREGTAATELVHDQEELYLDWVTIAAATTPVLAVHRLAAPQERTQGYNN